MSKLNNPESSILTSQLPVDFYFDPNILKKEQKHIFANSSIYIGNEKMVPEPGDWRTLAHEGGGRVLLRDQHGIKLLSNVCRHRQALILGSQTGVDANCASGNLCATGGQIMCPVHNWTYDTNGKLLKAPLFDSKPDLNLKEFPLQNFNGLLFEGTHNPAADLTEMFSRPEFDFSSYALEHVEIHHCNYNWKTFIEVYLEDYHVGPFHPGLGRFVTCDNLEWEFGNHHSIQKVGTHKGLQEPGTDIYRQWHDKLLAYRDGKQPEFGAIWVTYFPTHMIELYPHVLVLSTLYPVSPQETVNVIEFYYPEDIIAFEQDFIKTQQAAYMETAIEDDEIAERMDAGRKALLSRSVTESGPYQSPLEDGMEHFHAWYRQAMGISHQ